MRRPRESVRHVSWKERMLLGWRESAQRDRWSVVLPAIGWIHLAFFIICQWLYSRGDRSPIRFPALWFAELVCVAAAIRAIAGPGWSKRSPIAGFAVRVWCTFLILSFNVASLNTLTGFGVDWFKPVWATLSTFGFASMAYITTPWFFVPAVQMYFTGLLMASFPQYNYIIYGLSWWLALNLIGATVHRLARVPGEQASSGESQEIESRGKKRREPAAPVR